MVLCGSPAAAYEWAGADGRAKTMRVLAKRLS